MLLGLVRPGGGLSLVLDLPPEAPRAAPDREPWGRRRRARCHPHHHVGRVLQGGVFHLVNPDPPGPLVHDGLHGFHCPSAPPRQTPTANPVATSAHVSWRRPG